MSKKQVEPNLNHSDTYQTGVPEEPAHKSSVLTAVLLAMTIFFGGLASAMGFLNVRLLQQLQQTPSTLPVDIFTPSSAPSPGEDNLENDEPVPTLPAKRNACLNLLRPPIRTESQNSLSPAEIHAVNQDALVTVQATAEHATTKGLGIVMHAKGYILVNAHIVDAASHIYVKTADGEIYRAALVGTDMLTDLAVLYIQAQDLTVAAFGNSQYLQEDDFIASAEEPGQEPIPGCITNARHKVSRGDYTTEVMKTSVTCCDGPVFNRYGQVIGLSSSRVAGVFNLHEKQGIGYAVPSVTIKEVADQLMQKGFVAGRPTLALETVAISKLYQQYWDLPGGLRLLTIHPEAEGQGLQTDDILLALEGERLQTNDDLYRILFSHAIGDCLTAVVFRDGQSITLSLTIFDTAD